QVVLLVDGKVGATELDVQAHRYLRELGAEPVVAATKVDKVPRGRRAQMQRNIQQALEDANTKIIEVSAQTGEGVAELWRTIESFLHTGAPGAGHRG
ncbi:MAG: GTP-binding protein, partial [Thermoanaerobaculia bacterium]